MNLFLLKLFVKDVSDPSDPRVREKCASAAGVVGIVSNLALALAKVVLGVLTHSISVTADAVNNLGDAGSSVLTLVGFKLAGRPADEEHPYGHERIEYLTGLSVAMLIAFLGGHFLIDSVKSIFDGDVTVYTPVGPVVLILSILVKLWQSRFYRTVGRYIGSTALTAAAADSRNDVISTAAVLLGAVVSMAFDVNLDGYLGAAVAAFILVSGVKLVVETANPLLGAAPDPALIRKIGEKLLSYDGILGYHDLMVHNYGPDRRFASVHAEVSAERDLLESHDIIDNIEFDFLRELNIRLVIHLDPVVISDAETNELRGRVTELTAALSDECGSALRMHDFRLVRGRTYTNLIFDVTVPSGCLLSDRTISELLTGRIHALDARYNAVVTCDRGYLSETRGEVR